MAVRVARLPPARVAIVPRGRSRDRVYGGRNHFGIAQPSVTDEGFATIDQAARTARIEHIVAGFETLMRRLAGSHATEFLEIDVTMPQAKVLYLVAVAGELRMSDLVTQLGVSLSTVSGLVDRVVDHGLAIRREDPSDRRHVVVSLTAAGRTFVDRFHELNAAEVRALLQLLTDNDLDHVARAADALGDAAGKLLARAAPAGAGARLVTPIDVPPPATTERIQ